MRTDQRRRAAATLARAFHDDPLQRHVLPDETSRAARLPWLFDRVLRHAQRADGGVTVLEDAAAAACWVPTARLRLSPLDVVRGGFLQEPWRLGLAATRRLERHEASVLERVLPRAEGSGCLWLLGVEPVRSGEGLGRRAVDAALEEMAAAHLKRCVLWTEQPRNVGLCEHLGFEVVESFAPPASGVQVWVCETALRS